MAVEAGTCAGIATGAPMPPAPMRWSWSSTHGAIGRCRRCLQAVAPRQHVGRAGSDLVAGEMAVDEGHGAVAGAARRRLCAGLDRGRVSTSGRGSRSSRPAMRSSRRASARARADLRLEHGRALGGGLAHGGEPVVARARRRRSRGADRARSSVPRAKTWCCFLAARRLAIATTCSRSSPRAAGALRRPAAQAGQADGFCRRWRAACLRHAGQSRVVPDQRLLCSWRRCCAGWRICRRPPSASWLARLTASVSHRPAGIRCTRSAWRATRRCRCSRDPGEITSLAHADGYFEIPATSRRWRRERSSTWCCFRWIAVPLLTLQPWTPDLRIA